MNESKFIQRIHRRLPATIYAVKFADRFTAGIPDCWYSGSAGDLWVEYKYWTPGKTKPRLSKLQELWLNARHTEGRNVAVIVGSSAGGLVLRNKEWTNICYDRFDPLDEIVTWIINETDTILCT